MRNLRELDQDIDSVNKEIQGQRVQYYRNRSNYFAHIERGVEVTLPVELEQAGEAKTGNWSAAESTKVTEPTAEKDSSKATAPTRQSSRWEKVRPTRRGFLKGLSDSAVQEQAMQAIEQRNTSSALANLSSSDSLVAARLDSVLGRPVDGVLLSQATARARSLRSEISSAINTLDVYNTERRVFEIQWHKILASSLACIAMFLIGAPLGAIIKKGGLGVPFLVSILFFIIYYLLTMAGEKWAKQGIIAVPAGVWAADVILFIIGLIFLRQARLDARLFDADAYLVAFDKFRIWLVKRGILPQTT
jgi:lipopolysaccharide export system permease protein